MSFVEAITINKPVKTKTPEYQNIFDWVMSNLNNEIQFSKNELTLLLDLDRLCKYP